MSDLHGCKRPQWTADPIDSNEGDAEKRSQKSLVPGLFFLTFSAPFVNNSTPLQIDFLFQPTVSNLFDLQNKEIIYEISRSGFAYFLFFRVFYFLLWLGGCVIFKSFTLPFKLTRIAARRIALRPPSRLPG